jgi:pyruvate dehydrogenase E2 component (dihydrolipoamide acetyltransferase)
VDAAVKVPKVNASFDEDALIQYQTWISRSPSRSRTARHASGARCANQVAARNQRNGQGPRLSRAAQANEAGGVPRRHVHCLNLGGHGIDSFSAIINPPQGFILAIGAITKRAVADDCDNISVGQRMSITMSCDHRVIDGALGAEYLKEIRRLLENPTLLLI